MVKIRALQGATTSYFHVVPSEMSRVTVSPERRAIERYLERVGSDRFVEFISDILVQAEGHTLIGVTDGPGMETTWIYSWRRVCEKTARVRRSLRTATLLPKQSDMSPTPSIPEAGKAMRAVCQQSIIGTAPEFGSELRVQVKS